MRNIVLAVMGVIFLSTPIVAQKTVFWPNEWNNPGDDFYNRLTYDRSYQSDNFVIFWGDLVGTDPANYSDPAKRFNPVSVADTLEKIYDRFITELQYVSDDPSTNLGKYKIIIVMLGTFTPPERNGFAFGGSYSNTIGAMWVDPSATRDGGALSHELVHSLQNMHRIQENPNPGGGFVNYEPAGFFYEGHANYMRTLMYQWMANTDVPRWLATRSFHWSSTRHHYANFHLMYYVQEMDGFQMMTRLWKESIRNEHPLMTLRRLKGLNQDGLNDFLWGYAKKQATFDYLSNGKDEVVPTNNFGSVIRREIDRITSRNPRFLWKQYTILDKVEGSNNRYYVNDDWAPQDYGVNVIRLHPTCDQADKKVFVKFKGHTEVNPNFAGWRYGFVTSKPDGTVSRYSEMYSDNEGEISFELLDNEDEIYLVVMGAPKEHTSYVWEPGYPRIKRYPYEVAIENAYPEGHQDPADFRSTWKTNGRIHSNGGGWVSNGASVASSVYVGPYAIVRSGNISGNVRIEDHAWVEAATVRDNVIIRGNACIFRGTYSGNAIVEGNAFVENGGANTNALVTGNVFAFGPTYGGDVVMGGDSENGSCSNGVYLQFPHGNNGRTNCDGQGAGHWSNQDVNPDYSFFSNQQMAFAESTACDAVSTDCAGVIGGNAYYDNCGKCIGGTTGQQSDDSDNDGVLDCDDGCPNDPNKTQAGICGCGVADNTCVSDETFTFNVFMDPMSDYTSTPVQLDGNAIAAAFNMTQQELINAFGTTVTYAGVEPNGTLNPNSTAIAPGHWYTQNGNTVGYGNDAYIYAELNMNTLVANIGQFPDRSTGGEQYTIRQALVYTVGGSSVQVTLVYNVSINSNEPDADNDGVPDSQDACPNDPNKAATAGVCGCGNIDVDVDNDGICDTVDDDLDNDGVVTADDCNDSDPNIGAATTWYADTDNDGVGEAGTTTTACTPPQGYVATAGDACPNDGNKTTPGDCGCGVEEGTCLDCAGVPNGNATTDACGICSGGTTGITPCALTLQAEDACVVDGTIDNNNAGFNGSGFANTTNALDVQIVLSIESANATTTTVGFTYANGGTPDRPATVMLNGNPVGTLTFSSTGAWTAWEVEPMSLSFVAGVNVLTLTATTANGIANLDQLNFETAGFTIGSCATDCNGDVGGMATTDVCGKCIGGNTGATSDDTDADGVPDCQDQCPNDPNKTSPGSCGCGVPDVDSDADGILNCDDEFPNDRDNDGVATIVDCDDNNPNVGLEQTWYADTDNDGLGDANNTQTACSQPEGYVATSGDECPNDVNKTMPGECGCGATEQSCLDCAGVPFGNAFTDNCNVCVGGSTGETACTQDCSGEWGGAAAIDVCNECTGGTTGLEPVTDPNLCIATAVDAFETEERLIYPNPTTGMVYINITAEWVLYDMTGLEIQRGNETQFSLNDHAPGIYFLHIDHQIVKVIKE